MRGREVRLEQASVTYPNGFTAVHPTDLRIEPGEFFSILGPSGCGKTTILRTVSGFQEPSTGRVLIGGEDMAGIGPNGRPTALIFQNLALFPLMTVWENVAFGLEARGMKKADRRRRAEELLALVALTGQEDKKPTELSGGQRQRVAVARGLAVEPAVLLLDEPLSALDLKLRQHMRAELRSIQKKTGVTFIYITHDQGEALTMSDRIAVMNHGRVEQVGHGDEIYANPASAFVASFVGETNAIPGRLKAADGKRAWIETPLGAFTARNPHGVGEGREAMLFIRPEAMRFGEGENRIEARVTRRDLEGAFVNIFAEAGGRELALHLTNTGDAGRSLDGPQSLTFDTGDALILPKGELARTGKELAEA
ncbi:MAG: ABC transporter ATP-binding protein [Pseudomonadota bacterium]